MQNADRAEERLEAVDLALRLIELLAASPQPRALGDIARALDITKPRAHRHLRALLANDYVRQDGAGERYEISARLLSLGDQVRLRLSWGGIVRQAMAGLLERTDQSVTVSTLVGGEVTIVELLRGRTIVQFAVRPGTIMNPLRSAHGRVALAYGGLSGIEGADEGVLAQVRAQGWAAAPDEIMRGVNALAAPVFGHDGRWQGTIAIVGSTEIVTGTPAQIDAVTAAAREASERLGWRG